MATVTENSMSLPEITLEGLNQMEAEDQSKILNVLQRLLVGFKTRNVEMLQGIYTVDTDWVNAFGSVKKGAAEIIAYLKGLFADANFSKGQPIGIPTNKLRKITNDVIIISTHLQVKGQGLVEGGTIPLRDNHSLHILHKQANNEWLIVSELFMDARTDWSYIGHS
jgi:uncharacterized protein (TIGR02246 family)